MEVVPGIYQLLMPVPFTLSPDTNVYLIEGDQGWLMVDVGWDTPQAFQALEQQLQEIGLEFKDITKIVITHAHPDHYILADRVKQLSHAELVLHQKEKEHIERRYVEVDSLVQEMTKWMGMNGMPTEELPGLEHSLRAIVKHVTPVMPDTIIGDGELISAGPFQFQVLWTPGHSQGHICLYEREKRILISGDHILPVTTPNVGIHFIPHTNPLDQYLNSLTKMRELDVNLILPAHEHVFQGLQQRIAELFQHHQERKDAVANTIQDEPKTAYQIAAEIPWMKEFGRAGWQGLSPFNRRLALGETLSHLESLTLKGTVEKITNNGLIFYHHL